MLDTARLQVSQLEEREVPSAVMFADIRSGIWGSYPLNLTPSGSTLFFSADNGHGYELYSTDGAPGSTRMVKDIKPGLGGSNPGRMITADNGIVYFAANDGTGRALWRSDGTAAGTKKVPGMPAEANLDLLVGIGHNGRLHFTTGYTVGDPAGTQSVKWWTTDGTTTTQLRSFGTTTGIITTFEAIDGEVVLVRRHGFDRPESMWKYNPTTGATTRWQTGAIGYSPETGSVYLGAGVEIAPGKFVHASMPFSDTKAGLWTTTGQNTWTSNLVKSFGDATIQTPMVKLGGKVYFAVYSADEAVDGLWATDGTAAGTTKTDLPLGDDQLFYEALTPFFGRILVRTGSTTSGHHYYVTDGTAAGTAELPRPAGSTGGLHFVALVPPGPGEPRGAALFRSGSQDGPLFRTDGTAAGTAWVDPAGLPTGYRRWMSDGYLTDGFGRVVQPSESGGVYFNGGLYFSAANGEQRSELWKWDAPAPAGAGVAPTVQGVTVTDGSPQRSVVTGLTVQFDRRVNIEDGALSLKDSTGKTYLIYIEDPVSGQDYLSLNFGGGSLPDGRYTLTIKAGRVTDAETGGALAADYTFNFTRLFGDLNGDGVYDRDTRWMVRNSLGLHVGDAGYLVALDSNADGVIDATDELAAVRNWGKSA